MTDKILVVDDEPDIVDLTRIILERAGYHVVVANEGNEALQKTDAELPDLILLDVVLPGKSGLEIAEILKEKTRTKHIPILFFTALGRESDRELTKKAGGVGHILKPFTQEILLAEIKKHLELAKIDKFSKQLGIKHSTLNGKKILLEFDPLSRYEMLLRDFALESTANQENTVVLTPVGSRIKNTLKDEQDIKIIDLTADTMISSILTANPKRPLNLIYDSLTDFILTTPPDTIHRHVQNCLKLLSDPSITTIFLLNPDAHDERTINSIRGLFANRIVYRMEGLDNIKINPSHSTIQDEQTYGDDLHSTSSPISFQVDEQLWKRFIGYAVNKWGTSKGLRKELETAIAEYLEQQEEND